MKNLQELSIEEQKNTDGGGLIPLMFVAGVLYGYTLEKVESGQWKF